MSTAAGPDLSVLIASRDRRELLRRCLTSLAGQTLDPGRFEVLIADDGSTDGTGQMLAELATPFSLRHLALAAGGKAAALNQAIEAAAAPLCVFLDDDVIADPGLLAAHLAAHREEPRTLGLGDIHQQPIEARDWFARAFAREWNEAYDRRATEAATWNECYGANLSAPTAALREVGGIAPIAVGEDLDLGYRLWQAGCAPTFLALARCVHDDQKPGRRILENVRLQGKAHVDLAERRPETKAELLNWSRTVLPGELAARRALIALRFPPHLLAALGPLMPGRSRQIRYFDFVKFVTFWGGVREAVGAREWRALTS